MYKNLVIIGGGFAGIRAAQLLEHALPPDWIRGTSSRLIGR